MKGAVVLQASLAQAAAGAARYAWRCCRRCVWGGGAAATWLAVEAVSLFPHMLPRAPTLAAPPCHAPLHVCSGPSSCSPLATSPPATSASWPPPTPGSSWQRQQQRACSPGSSPLESIVTPAPAPAPAPVMVRRPRGLAQAPLRRPRLRAASQTTLPSGRCWSTCRGRGRRWRAGHKREPRWRCLPRWD